MNPYSVITRLFRSKDDGQSAIQVRQPILVPRTQADELPPYRDQPWIIDKGGYRKVDPAMTFVPVSRL